MIEKPLIFDIERSTTANGRGIRTAVFFKGCRLDCYWCHNPESKLPEKEAAFFEEKCIGCGACKRVTDNKDTVCPTSARRVYGKEYSVSEIYDIVRLDKAYYDATGGGVTLSGGECMLQIDFLEEILKKCKENGLHTAVDTAGNVPYEYFERILLLISLSIIDLASFQQSLVFLL